MHHLFRVCLKMTDTQVLTKEILVHVHLIVYMYQWLFNQVQGKSPG